MTIKLIESLYGQILSDFKGHIRPFLKLSRPQAQELAAALTSYQQQDAPLATEENEKILCVLGHVGPEDPKFFPYILHLLEKSAVKKHRKLITANIMILTLACFRKQVMGYHQKMGDKIPRPILMALSHALDYQDTEVEEWTLRTLDELNLQALPLYEKIKLHQPKWPGILLPSKNKLVPLYQELLKKLENLPHFPQGGNAPKIG